MYTPEPEIIENNHRSAHVLTALWAAIPFVIVAVVLIVLLPWWLAIIIAAAVTAALVWWRLNGADQRVLSLVGATSVATMPSEHPGRARLENLVEGLCATAGVRQPSLHIIDDGASNALVVGRSEQAVSLVVTSGMIDTLDRVELEGVIAQLLAQVRAGDTVPRTTAVALLSPLASVATGVHDRVVDRLVDPDRRFRNDAIGASITRYPPGLVAAYERMLDAGTEPRRRPAATEHLWLLAPRTASSTHPATSTRIAALREL